ncbi:hypothetical protein ACFXJ5_08755 [Streptomyces sp. NPDC059373]
MSEVYPDRAKLDVKYLLALELTDPGFDHTVPTGFRDRLLAQLRRVPRGRA